tara:strand:- start:15686 stop:16111 length:426 start_codon:yes stop_codon:yes gene_type:complete
MNFKVTIDGKRVSVTIGVTGELKSLESRTGDWLGRILPCPCAIDGNPTDSRSLHPWLVAEGFVANYEDIRCLDSYSHDEENVTHVFRIRWVPEKWAEKKPVVDPKPIEPKVKQRKQKNKPLNLEKLEKDIDKKFDENNKDV